jgi:hypothetical protein
VIKQRFLAVSTRKRTLRRVLDMIQQCRPGGRVIDTEPCKP